MVRLIVVKVIIILSDKGTACSIAVLENYTDCSIYGKYVAGFIIINEGNTTFSKRINQAAVVSLLN